MNYIAYSLNNTIFFKQIIMCCFWR